MSKKQPTIIRETWEFYRKHPVLSSVSIWFLALPLFGMSLVDRFMGRSPSFADTALRKFLAENDPWHVSNILLSLILSALLFWGVAAVLVVSRRMLGHPAGRARTSLTSVRKEAMPYMFPLLATSILRDCITFLWTFLFFAAFGAMLAFTKCGDLFFALMTAVTNGKVAPDAVLLNFFAQCPVMLLVLPILIPAVWFRLRTALFWIAAVGDDTLYRSSFRASANVMKGQFWKTVGRFVLLLVAFQGVATLIASLLDDAFVKLAPNYLLVSDLVGSVIIAFGMTLFFIGLTILYTRVKGE